MCSAVLLLNARQKRVRVVLADFVNCYNYDGRYWRTQAHGGANCVESLGSYLVRAYAARAHGGREGRDIADGTLKTLGAQLRPAIFATTDQH